MLHITITDIGFDRINYVAKQDALLRFNLAMMAAHRQGAAYPTSAH